MKWQILSPVVAGLFLAALWLAWSIGYARGRKSKMRPPQPASLEDQIDLLFGLFLRTYALYLYVRPMMANRQVIAQYGARERRAGFEELRNALYWTFVLELTKICDDLDNRTSSIAQIRNALRKPEVILELEKKSSPIRLPKLPEESSAVWKTLAHAEAAEMRTRFNKTLVETSDKIEKLLNSSTLKSYRKVRNKRIAHNELIRDAEGKYGLFEIADLGLKYGDERAVLALVKEIMDGLNSIVRRASFSWESFLEPEERDVRGFWGVEKLD